MAQQDGLRLSGHVVAIARDKDGNILWKEEGSNILFQYGLWYWASLLSGPPQSVESIYMLPIQAATNPNSNLPVLNYLDRHGFHPGWVEVTNYQEPTRPLWDNMVIETPEPTEPLEPFRVSNPVGVLFTISTTPTYIGGVALITKNNTKNNVILAQFLAAKAFSAVRVLNASDVLEVKYSIFFTNS